MKCESLCKSVTDQLLIKKGDLNTSKLISRPSLLGFIDDARTTLYYAKKVEAVDKSERRLHNYISLEAEIKGYFCPRDKTK